MFRTLDVPGEQVKVHAEIGPGRILRATFLIEENGTAKPASGDADSFGKELDDVLALTNPVAGWVGDLREAMYKRDDGEFGGVTRRGGSNGQAYLPSEGQRRACVALPMQVGVDHVSAADGLSVVRVRLAVHVHSVPKGVHVCAWCGD